MEKTKKIYLPIYERIEREVLELASAIYFNDEQANVYSLNIAEIIIRCAVEIESITREIYRKETEEDPGEDTGKCIKWLNKNWHIQAKKVQIISPYFHFGENAILMPFKYKKGSAEDYHSVYNAIKHDREKNLKKLLLWL